MSNYPQWIKYASKHNERDNAQVIGLCWRVHCRATTPTKPFSENVNAKICTNTYLSAIYFAFISHSSLSNAHIPHHFHNVISFFDFRGKQCLHFNCSLKIFKENASNFTSSSFSSQHQSILFMFFHLCIWSDPLFYFLFLSFSLSITSVCNTKNWRNLVRHMPHRFVGLLSYRFTFH